MGKGLRRGRLVKDRNGTFLATHICQHCNGTGRCRTVNKDGKWTIIYFYQDGREWCHANDKDDVIRRCKENVLGDRMEIYDPEGYLWNWEEK